MPEKDELQSPDTPVVDYAFWDAPGTAVKVVYSLQLFHEIDFLVNEGYRKIPHGGIEVGGLLFGTISGGEVRIEAFRPIDCEHASGPSLQLSERDLNELENQLTAPNTDRDLAKFAPIGWFLAHTRGPLELTEAEAKQFDRFFPEAAKLTVLVKPERFQPTRFGFLVRKADGVMPREATTSAVILPLPGRSHKAGQLIASIPAPAVTTAAKRAATPSASKPPVDDFEEEAEAPKPVRPKAQKAADAETSMSIWKVPPEPDTEISGERDQISEAPIKPTPPTEDFRSPAERAARRQLARDRARVMEEGFAPMSSPLSGESPFPAAPPFRPAALPSLPASAARPRFPNAGPAAGAGALQRFDPEYADPAYAAALANAAASANAAQAGARTGESVLNARSVSALAIAALLGCLVGYIGYLQLPPPVIPLDVRPMNQTIVVSWPPTETRNAIYAAIRFNDGAPVPLSAEEKMAGQVSLAAEKDFKVEVMTRNWIRDSRGIVRYMHSAQGNSQVVPLNTPLNNPVVK